MYQDHVKRKTAPGQKDWDDIKNRWATPLEMSEGSTRDKRMGGGGEVIHDKDEHTRNVRGKKKKKGNHQSARRQKKKKI